jgi:predicted DNA-binding transcriptional regulator AlpA
MSAGDGLYLIGEVAFRLRMETKTLRRLIETGEFPRPLQPSPGIQVWSDEDIEYYRLRMQLRPRLRPSRKKPPEKKRPPTETR